MHIGQSSLGPSVVSGRQHGDFRSSAPVSGESGVVVLTGQGCEGEVASNLIRLSQWLWLSTFIGHFESLHQSK